MRSNAFLIRPLVLTDDDLANRTIVATQEKRLLPSRGDLITAKNIKKGISAGRFTAARSRCTGSGDQGTAWL